MNSHSRILLILLFNSPSNAPLKLETLSSPSFLKNLVGGSTLRYLQQKKEEGGGVHTMTNIVMKFTKKLIENGEQREDIARGYKKKYKDLFLEFNLWRTFLLSRNRKARQSESLRKLLNLKQSILSVLANWLEKTSKQYRKSQRNES